MDTFEDPYREMREYSRVDAYLPIEVRRLPEAQRDQTRSRTSAESVLINPQALPDVEDKVLAECLKILNTKLDTIINLLTFQATSACSLQFTPVNISAGGVGVVLQDPIAPGDLVEIRMMFPTEAYVVFYIYGEVVRSERDAQGGYPTCVQFTEIDEDIRNRIAKYVFEKQREQIRKKRRQ